MMVYVLVISGFRRLLESVVKDTRLRQVFQDY